MDVCLSNDFAEPVAVNLLPPPVCTLMLSASNGVIEVNQTVFNTLLEQAGCVPDANTTIELWIPAGQYTAAKFEGLNTYDAPNNPRIVIKRSPDTLGEVRFSGYTYTDGGDNETKESTIQILNCHNLEFAGQGIFVENAYGSGIPGDDNNKQAVDIREASSYIYIHDLDVQNPSGFAGIMAKDSPECEGGNPVNEAEDGVPFMHHIYIYDNYIHNVPQGEGIYAGDTAFMTGRPRGDCGRLHPPKIEFVEIYQNFIQNIGLDAIQLGSCIKGGKIHDNFCVEYGTEGEFSQANGIQIGLGNINTVCERNFIRQSSERSDNVGHGILCQGAGNNCIKNNIIYNTLENAIYVREQTGYRIGEVPDHQYITDAMRGADTIKGVNIVHNTIMYPGKGVNTNIYGIRVTHNSNTGAEPPPSCVVENNLIFGTITAVDVDQVPDPKCNENNRVISQDWEQVKEQYLRSYGEYPIPATAPYASAMETYFMEPMVNEEDNYFRSPTDFYPVHPDIINQATNNCMGSCAAGADFLGTSRSAHVNCVADHGAIELDYPVINIVEDCENSTFTIEPDDQTGTFTWTFDGTSSTQTNPTFNNPGTGLYPLYFTYTSTDGCIQKLGKLIVELSCSCLCEGENAINIDAQDGISWQTFAEIMQPLGNGNTLDLTNSCMTIKGRLLIDDRLGGGQSIDLHLANGFIRMLPGSEIVVQDQGGLRISNMNTLDGRGVTAKGIHGCDYMWEGIDVEEGGRIEVENSTIQDAITAIGITGTAAVQIKQSRFENNYRGLDIGPVIDPTNNDPIPFNLTPYPNWLSGNFFSTLAGGLKGTVDGGIPVGTTKGNVGVKMSYLRDAIIEGEPNTFKNLRHGIYANQSVLSVTQNAFEQVDYGARLFYTPAIFELNTFEEVALRGIDSRHASMLVAKGNTMTDMEGRGINYEETPSLFFSSITDNTIASQGHGINVETTPSFHELNIAQNKLSLLSPVDDTPLDRSAIRVYCIGQGSISFSEISHHAPITVNGYGKGIALENVIYNKLNYNHIDLINEITLQDAEYRGISLENAGYNELYGNSVEAAGFTDSRGFHFASSANNTLCCNSTDGGGTGLYFSGPSSSEDGLNNTTIGDHNIGLLCDEGTRIGAQNHRGNTWENAYASAAAEHRGTREQIRASIFRVEGLPSTEENPSPYWPAEDLIIADAAGEEGWFEPSAGNASACADNDDCQPAPVGDPPGGKESDQKVAEGDYAIGDYAVVHNWEAGLELFERLKQNETLRNSEVWYQSFYAQANTSAIGEYTDVREQFKALLSLSSAERDNADALWATIQTELEQLTQLGEAYSAATTGVDSMALEAAWLEQYAKVSDYFAAWQTLSEAINQRIDNNFSILQAANAALPEDILSAANEKLMNTVQLQRILGEPLSEKQYADVTALAFSCPLIAGNAVYRARTLLRTMGNYAFDDADICGLDKEGKEGVGKKNKAPDIDISKPILDSQWQIYPNPAKHQLWVAGSQMEDLQTIRLFDGLGRPVLQQQSDGEVRMEMQLPFDLQPGIYFLRLRLDSGEVETRKILLQP